MSDGGLGKLVESLERSVLGLTKGIREAEKERTKADLEAAVERERLDGKCKALDVRIKSIEDAQGLQAAPVTVPGDSPLRKLPLPLEEESRARTKVWVALAALIGSITTIGGGLVAKVLGLFGAGGGQ